MKRPSRPEATRCGGFTLIEMAVALVVVTLLLGGLLLPLATQMEQQRLRDAERAEALILEALMGYAMANGSLPCPDTDGNPDGLENRVAGSPVELSDPPNWSQVPQNCTAYQGTLPYQTLGVAGVDPWDSLYLYRVTEAFAQRQEIHDAPSGGGNLVRVTSFGLDSDGDLNICATAACAASAKLADSAAAVVVSLGKNRGQCATPPCPDESENTDGDKNYVSRTTAPPGSLAGEFDDVVTWLSPNVLKARMVAAERLP